MQLSQSALVFFSALIIHIYNTLTQVYQVLHIFNIMFSELAFALAWLYASGRILKVHSTLSWLKVNLWFSLVVSNYLRSLIVAQLRRGVILLFYHSSWHLTSEKWQQSKRRTLSCISQCLFVHLLCNLILTLSLRVWWF